MSNIFIRKMEEKDIDAVSNIDRICFTNLMPPINYKGEFENKIAHYFIAECNNTIVGFIGFWYFADQADIINIAVLPEYRRKKIGTKLLLSALRESLELNVQYVTLEVRITNVSAQNLYKKFEFVNQGIRKGYYLDNREDAVNMGIENLNKNIYEKVLTEIEKTIHISD